MTDFKPNDPLGFAKEYFKALAVKEEQEVGKYEATKESKKKKRGDTSRGDTSQQTQLLPSQSESASAMSLLDNNAKQSHTLDATMYRVLLLECSRASRNVFGEGSRGRESRSKGSARLHELLAEAYMILCGNEGGRGGGGLAVTSAREEGCCDLFMQLAKDMNPPLPKRAVEQLVRELRVSHTPHATRHTHTAQMRRSNQKTSVPPSSRSPTPIQTTCRPCVDKPYSFCVSD